MVEGEGEVLLAVSRNSSRESAIPISKDALKIDADHYPSHKALAEIYFELGEYTKSFEHYIKLIELTPDDPYLHYQIGMLYEISGDYNEALLEYEKIIDIDVNFELMDDVKIRMKRIIQRD